jgi:EAL domain-containing protein (putative c-di-GMP-specific phosphodiesterase class I)
VETKEQRDQLIALGCPLAQGFYFSMPVNSDAAEKALRESQAKLLLTINPEEALV